jgi:hypothetical protein
MSDNAILKTEEGSDVEQIEYVKKAYAQGSRATVRGGGGEGEPFGVVEEGRLLKRKYKH